MTLDEFGALVAAAEGRGKPYKKATVNAWIGERGEPKIATFEAMAKLAACDPWWIVWEQGNPPANVIGHALVAEERPAKNTPRRAAR